MQADVHTLCTSDFYHILDFRCRCKDCSRSDTEYTDSFCISFVRKGNFLFHVFRNSFDAYNGCILVTKPGYEHSVTHQHTIPDECTIIEFKQEFYNQLCEHYGLHLSGFFRNNDLHSLLLKTTAETEYLHNAIQVQLREKRASQLHIDGLVIELVEAIMSNLLDYQPVKGIDDTLKKNHLITIERAKDYLTTNFSDDVSLSEIARYCYVSPFHFSRIFKTFTSSSPHQYLMHLRLKHAEQLLKNTSLPVGDISLAAGFNSPQYFIAAFRQKYQQAPASFRVKQPTLQNSKIS